MDDLDGVETGPLPSGALVALLAGLRYRLVPASAVAVSVPPDRSRPAGDGWPRFVLAGRFAEGEPAGHIGVWCSGDCSVDDDGVASLAPVLAVNVVARRWSIWGADVTPGGVLRRTADVIVGSGLVTCAVEASLATQVRPG